MFKPKGTISAKSLANAFPQINSNIGQYRNKSVISGTPKHNFLQSWKLLATLPRVIYFRSKREMEYFATDAILLYGRKKLRLNMLTKVQLTISYYFSRV